jgi:hypothetical protein
MTFKQYSTIWLAILLLAALYACNNLNPDKLVGTELDPLPDPAQADTNKYNAEYLLFSTVKINGALPLQSKFAEFIKVLGKPDSIINFKAQMECQFYEGPYQYLYFQGCMFYLVKGMAIFQNINFRTRPDLELKTPVITLNARTTLKDVQKLFPKAVSKIRKVNDSDLEDLQIVNIGASKELADEWWILSFEGDELVSVEMYAPC